jgi:hypothetical protein
MHMSDHEWVLENSAGYVTGGLEDAERVRLEEHMASCTPCARAVQEAREVDRKIDALFAGVRPAPGLEDRMIHALRGARQRRPLRFPWYLKIAAGAAAVVLLALWGSFLNSMTVDGELRFPEMPWVKRVRDISKLEQGINSFRTQYAVDTGPVQSAMFQVTPEWHGNAPVSTEDVKDTDQMAAAISTKALEGIAGPSQGRQDTTLLDDSGSMGGQARLSTNDIPGMDSYRWFAPQSLGTQTKPPVANSDKNGDGFGYYVTPSTTSRGFSGTASTGLEKGQAPTAPAAGGGQPNLGNNIHKPAATSFDGTQIAGGGWGAGGAMGGKAMKYYSYRNDQPALKNSVAANAPGTATAGLGTSAAPVLGDNKTLRDFALHFKPAELDKVAGSKDEPTAGALPTGAQPAARPDVAANAGPGDQDKKPEPAATAPAGTRKIVIRSGNMEFEIQSFDSAVATIIKLVSDIKGGYVDTVNSEKLANGKVKGSVVVRVPPERLDTLVLDLRKELGKTGELKGQRIGSQDITKQYTDLESRLRAARAMEERLLAIIKNGKGEIKDLLAAEKELGVWRTKIEEVEGELRYYGSLVALSTLTITLAEKEIRAPYGIVETERVQMGIEVEDVEKARQEALTAVITAKGRITKSELKQHSAGQYSAVLNFEVAAEAAGPLRDRLKQLGTVARLEVDRLMQTEGGTGRPQDGKVTRSDAQFLVSIYNLANVAPRETVQINLACLDVEMVYRMIVANAQKTGRIVTSNLNSPSSQQTTGTIQLEVKTTEADALLQSIKAAGEVLRLQVTENPDVQNVTRAKRGFNIQLVALGMVEPRETANLKLAATDVPAAYRAVQEAVAKAKGRILKAQLNEQDKQNITAQLDFDVRRSEEPAITKELESAGDIYSRNVTRAADSDNVIDTKVRVQVEFVNAARLPPREIYTLGIEVGNVDQTAALLKGYVDEHKGRTAEAHIAHERSGRVTAKLVYEVPLSEAPALIDKFRSTGTVRAQQTMRNPQVPEGKLATARLDVTLSNAELIVPSDEGLWSQIRRSLATSFIALSWSLKVVIVGLSFVLPWGVAIYVIYRIVLRLRKKPVPAAPAA